MFRQRGRDGEREGEKYQCVLASHVPPTGDPAGNPGMCPDWESNQRPFGSQAGAQSTEPHQPGLTVPSLNKRTLKISWAHIVKSFLHKVKNSGIPD